MTDREAAARALLPCPFCGGEAELDNYGDGTAAVCCGNSKCAVGPITDDLQTAEAIAAWNRRTAAGEA